MSETQALTTQAGELRATDDVAKVVTALKFFRVMAIIAGVALLILCVELILHYGFHNEALSWWSPIHGLLFIVFMASVYNLGTKLRWTAVRMVGYICTAFVPVLSFWLEHRVNTGVSALLEEAEGGR
jgi:integral membrane protein